MSWVDSDYVKLLIHRPESGSDRWLIALRTTADHYGWTDEFMEWRPRPIGTSGRYQLCADPGRRGKMYTEGGRRHRISRDPSRRGHARGKTNAFKVSASCTLLDMAELAHFVTVDWYWMTAPNGQRFSREHWAEIYEAGTQRRGRGLVSV